MPCADGLERSFGVDISQFRKRAFLRDDDARQVVHFGRAQKTFPVEARRELCQLINRHRIVNRIQIALLCLCPACLRNPGFEINHVLRARHSLWPGHELK